MIEQKKKKKKFNFLVHLIQVLIKFSTNLNIVS